MRVSTRMIIWTLKGNLVALRARAYHQRSPRQGIASIAFPFDQLSGLSVHWIAGKASDQINSCSMSIPQPGTLPAALFYPCKVKLGAVGLCQNHAVAREFHLINSPGERRLDLNSVAI